MEPTPITGEVKKSNHVIYLIISAGLLIFAAIMILNSLDMNYKNGYAMGVSNTTNSSFQSGYLKGMNDWVNVSFQYGYSKGIYDTQNTTLMLGYCSAQQEAFKNGVLFSNNTALIIPITTLKEACFK